MTATPLVLPFADERCRDVSLSGGKGASLASMTQNGLPVPPGFVITSEAFSAAVDGDALLGHIKAQDLVDEVRTVTEDEVSRAVLLLLERAKLVVEPAGAAAAAEVVGVVAPVPDSAVQPTAFAVEQSVSDDANCTSNDTGEGAPGGQATHIPTPTIADPATPALKTASTRPAVGLRCLGCLRCFDMKPSYESQRGQRRQGGYSDGDRSSHWTLDATYSKFFEQFVR